MATHAAVPPTATEPARRVVRSDKSPQLAGIGTNWRRSIY